MRHPQSLVAGMMWFDPDRPDILGNIRHLALERDGTASQISRVYAGCSLSHLAYHCCVGETSSNSVDLLTGSQDRHLM